MASFASKLVMTQPPSRVVPSMRSTRYWSSTAKARRSAGYLVGDVSGVVPADLVERIVDYQSVAGGMIAFVVTNES